MTATVTVGVDDSAESRAALRWAARYTEAVGGALRAVTVWSAPVRPVGPGQMMAMPNEAETAGTLHDAASRRLTDALIEALEVDRAELVDRQVVSGDPAAVLLEQSTDSDVLVLGNGRHGALAGAVMGSVALHILRHATCPVVLVPPSEHRG